MKTIKNQSGITLVALVVTIIVLMILASISIGAIFSENGIIQQAKDAKKQHEDAVKAEEENLNDLMGEYRNSMNESGFTNGTGGGSGEGDTPTPTPSPTPNVPEEYKDNILALAPRVTEGMVRIKYNGSWDRVEDPSEKWYDYQEKEWANVVMPALEGESIFTTEGKLSLGTRYVQLVWIPRFAYKITSRYHTSMTDAGNIEIVFVDTNDKDINNKKYSSVYPSSTVGESSGMSDFVVHPAFNYGGEKLAGFWIGKFESSAYSSKINVRPAIASWRGITIGNAFAECLKMNEEGNPYGLNSDKSVVDPHLCKNDEWGAVAYLCQSVYGRNSEMTSIGISDFKTGYATVKVGSTTNLAHPYTEKAFIGSTTNNATGIYDMGGNAYEYVAAYVANGASNLTNNGGELVSNSLSNKYYNKYPSTVTNATTSQEADYKLAIPSSNYYGDAVYETTSRHTGSYTWYNDAISYPTTTSPFFIRGGYYGNGSGNPGIYHVNGNTGAGSSSIRLPSSNNCVLKK